MSFLVRVLLFLLVFTIEVRVKAEEGAHSPVLQSVLQQPENCLSSIDSSCAIQSDDESTFELALSKGKVVLDRATTVVRINDHEVRLIAGTIWVKPDPKQTLSVKAEFGEARANGEFWVSRDDSRMVVSANSKDVVLLARGSREELTIPSGLENYLGKVTKEGKAAVGLPTPIQPAEHLARWARLFKGKKADFEKEVAAFKTLWLSAKGEAVDMHQALYDRKIASLEQAASDRAKAREKVEARNRELRELFRRRVLNEE